MSSITDRFDFGRHSRGADVWSLGGRIAAQLIQVVGFAVLSRLLNPSEFGILAVAAIFAGFSQIFSDLGIASAIVSRSRLSVEFLSSAFWVNCIAGVVALALLGIAAVPLSVWLQYRELVWFIPLLGLSLPLSFSAVGASLLERAFRFRALGVAEIIAAVAGQCVGIFCAAGGLGLVSLALMQPVSAAINSILAMRLARWRPRLYLSWLDCREIASYVVPLIGANSVNYWARSVDNLLVAKMFTAEALAFYARAYQLMLAPVMQATLALGRVYEAALASERGNVVRMEIRYRHAAADVAMFGLLVSAVVAPNSAWIVALAFGPEWAPMSPLLGILSLSIAPQVVTSLNGAALRAARRTRELWWLGVLNSGLLVIGLAGAAFWSTYAIAWTIVVHSVLVMPSTVMLACRTLKFSSKRVLMDVGCVVPVPLLLGVAQVVIRGLGDLGIIGVICVEVTVLAVAGTLCVTVVRRRARQLAAELRDAGGSFTFSSAK